MANEADNRALSHLRVLDLTDDKGVYCAKLLADLGADTVKIEPPGGHPTRKIGPFVDNVPHPERSLHWFHYNTNKRSVTLDITRPEGRALFEKPGDADAVVAAGRFVDNRGRATEIYPLNPNGSAGGLTAVTTADGRFTAIMPHPERVFRTVQLSWHPEGWGEDSPWMRLFRNARVFVG